MIPRREPAGKTLIVLLMLAISTLSIAFPASLSTHVAGESSNVASQFALPTSSAPIPTTSNSTSFTTLPAWTNATRIPSPREGYGAAEVKGIIYYITGFGLFGDSTTNEAYNVSSNTWATKASLPSASRSETVAVTDGSYIYLIGGRPVFNVGHDLWRYNPTNDTWTSLAPMPTARATEHMAVYYHGKIYVSGGRTSDAPSSSGDLAVMEIYDIASNSWSTGTPMLQPLADGHAVLLNGKIYIFGGFTSTGTASSNTFIYDISSGIWTVGAPSPDGRVDPGVGVCGPLIYMIGGSTASLGLQTSNYVYNPMTDSWNTSLPIPIRTAEAQAVSYKGQIYVVSGGIYGSGGGNPASQVFHCADDILYVSPARQPARPPGATITYKIKVANMQPFNGWDIRVRTNQSVVNPVSASIAGNLFQANFSATVSEITNCVNGHGIGCRPGDGHGIVHSAAVKTGPPLPLNGTADGLLLTITYTSTAGTFSPVTIFNDTLLNGSQTPISHTTLSGIYGTPPPDFALSAFPAHVIVGQGSTGTTSIIVQSLNNFTGNVNLSATALPSGPTVTFTPNPVSVAPNGLNVTRLTVSTITSSTLGNYTIIALGRTGSLSRSVTISVTVIPDFSIAANPDSSTLIPGARVTSTITLTSKGFAGSLVLSTTTTPLQLQGPSVFLNQSFVFLSALGTSQVTLFLSTFTSTTPANYTVTVTATGTLSHSVAFSLNILAPKMTLSLIKGPVGTKVTVQGFNFPFVPGQQFPDRAYVSFDDILLGTAPILNGTFTFVLDVPQAQPGLHQIKAHDYNTGGFSQVSFLVIPTFNPVIVTVQAGTVYFPGDSAVIGVLTTQAGILGPTGVQIQIVLIRPDGSNISLSTTPVMTGLFTSSYTIPRTGLLGTYAILARALIAGQQVGTALQTFEVALSWLSSNAGNVAGALTLVSVIGLVGVAWKKGYLKRKPEDETPSFF